MQNLGIIFIVAATLRVFIHYSEFEKWLTRRQEIDSPISSWSRVLEGAHMQELRVGAYSGDLFHDSPICLGLGVLLSRCGLQSVSWLIFIGLDIFTGYLLYKFICRLVVFMAHEEQTVGGKSVHATSKPLALSSAASHSKAVAGVAVYLLNPFGVAACAAKSTSVIYWLTITAALAFAVRGRTMCTVLCLSLGMLQRIHTIGIALPVLLFCARVNSLSQLTGEKRNAAKLFLTYLAVTVSLSALWLLISAAYFETELRQLLSSTVLYQLDAAEHKPNFGLYWYFLAEMFEHFRPFFVSIFHLLSIAPLVPALIKYWHYPQLLLFITLAWTCIMSPYPALNDYAYYLSLLPVFWHLMPFTRQILITCVMTVASIVLAPVMWHQWVETGTGNANFYYAVTLAFNAAQILLFTDFMIAHEKRLAILEYGIFLKNEHNEHLVIKMQ